MREIELTDWDQFVFTLLVMALIGNMIAQAFAGNPASVNFAMFVSAFSLLSLFYLVPASWNEAIAGHPMIVVAVDLLNVIFFLSAGIALAARLHVHNCNNIVRLHPVSASDIRHVTWFRIRADDGWYVDLRVYQWCHQWQSSTQPPEALPRGPSFRCVPLVRLRLLYCFVNHVHSGCPLQHGHECEGDQAESSVHGPGLSFDKPTKPAESVCKGNKITR
jgi:Membrane-associating domain